MNEPLRPRFDPTISVRDVVTLLAVVITGFVAFSVINSRVEALEKSDNKQDTKIEELTRANIEIGKQLTELGVDIRYLRRAAEEEKRLP
jgi:peptidoglycan hydrolase CwlO-like protein